jgi:hypothetical protein
MHDVLTTALEEVRITSTAAGSVFCRRKGAPYQLIQHLNALFGERSFLTSLFMICGIRLRAGHVGVDCLTVKELIGLQDITITLRYIHLSGDRKRSVVRTLEWFGIWWDNSRYRTKLLQ